jgi:tetratricopeptide (TPR) repeat protein
MIARHPVLGVGLGGWQFAYPAYDRGDWITDRAAPQRPHNDLLWILSETGILGLAAYVWLLGAVALLVWRAMRTHPGSTRALLALGVATGVLALLGHSLVSFPRERIAPSMMFWFGLGAATGLVRGRSLPGARRTRWPAVPAALGGLALALGLVMTLHRLRFDEHYLRALNAWRAGSWPTVSAEAERALRWGVLNHRALLLKGLAAQRLGRLDRAVQAYETALRYHPNEGHAALAAAYAGQGRHALAERHYRAEQRLYPRSREAALGLADALRDQGKHAEAAAAYRHYLSLGPADVEALNRLGASLQAAGDLEGALTAFKRARERAPEDARTCNNVGVVETALGRYAEAEAAYREAVRLNPEYARAYHNLGDLYRETGRKTAAVAAYRTFLAKWRGDPRYLDAARRKMRLLEEHE